MQHSTGLYKKIANLKNPEDIQKWREERKKKYPTKANVEKKLAATKEKIERGEKMGLDRRNNRNRYNNDKDFKSGKLLLLFLLYFMFILISFYAQSK